MTLKGEQITTTQIVIGAFQILLGLIISIACYYAKRSTENTEQLKIDVAVIKVQMEQEAGYRARLEGEVADLRVVTYDHIYKRDE